MNAPEQSELQPFKDYRQDEIPHVEKGTFQLDQIAILGHFPQGNSALLKDYESFLEMLDEDPDVNFGMVRSLINVGDLESLDEVDNLVAEEATGTNYGKKEEKEKFFVLDTDASKEEIIESMAERKGMVVYEKWMDVG